jgi:D-threo-aldose 1-dehydrogenase
VVAAGVFNSGVLAGGSTYDYESASPAVLERVHELQEICSRREIPLAAVALQFPVRHPAVASVLVGCRTPNEVEEDVRLFELPLTEELWSELV